RLGPAAGRQQLSPRARTDAGGGAGAIPVAIALMSLVVVRIAMVSPATRLPESME
ncbi:MAG: hypothetical protein RLZZ565_323, partial [Planctomycetota bacterium]